MTADVSDPLLPPPPRNLYFDEVAEAWVLSRHRDVQAGFLTTRRLVLGVSEPGVWPMGKREDRRARMPGPIAQIRMRGEAHAAFLSARMTHWRTELEVRARSLIQRWPEDCPVDLVSEVIQPWCLDAAGIVTGTVPHNLEFIRDLATDISRAAAEPTDPSLVERAARANEELGKYLQSASVCPVAVSFERTASQARTFVGLSHTLASLLANGWLALLRFPSELVRLRAQPELMNTAIDEIFRYGCVPQLLYRYAARSARRDPRTEHLKFRKGDRVILMLASANRDPDRFPEPHRFDAARPGGGHVSLGFGPHFCVGAPLLRMAAEVATSAFVASPWLLDASQPLQWKGGSGFRSPVALQARVSH